ncbi:ferrochelatase [Nocardioides mangrovicus]|uniref:Coproporphyrin III ferrochelatase n=1 Tax=Nocardioides mangrovicus TaxID=2478913 RepID=A0A3L8P3T9_9ACTN|nr:ferrochelatase [Nocardioides mangrovicus]RLV49453.1 ferrochelatase [Nocardioides mangrovicus]
MSESVPESQPVLSTDVSPYDALLLVSFGGPEQPEDVVPFLRNVTAGRDIPDERLAEVGEHYYAFGGRSPINDQNRALAAAIREDLAGAGVDLPIYWGNRNWGPFLLDELRRMRDDGVRRALCLVTSAYSSYSGCRQYREDLTVAREALLAEGGAPPPELDKARVYFNHPGFVEPMVDATLAALADLPDDVRREAELVFVTHSVPEQMNEASGPLGRAYVAQHRSTAAEVVERVRLETGLRHGAELVYCSRSGSPRIPWLEPDVNDHLRALATRGAKAVVLVPIGFVSDHMEVVYDLDTEALATAGELGLPCVRAATAGVDPRFVAMVRDLLLERAAGERGEDPVRTAVGSLPAAWDRCAPGCCTNPRSTRPAVVGSR